MSEAMENEPEVRAKPSRRAAPNLFWVVAVLSLLWNTGGAFDYAMTQMRNADYMASFTPEQIAFFTTFPAWFEAFWAIGVWGAFVGSVLLLARSRHAVAAFAVSLVGLLVTTLATLLMGQPDSLNTWGNWLFTAMIWIITILLLRFSQRYRARGILS